MSLILFSSGGNNIIGSLLFSGTTELKESRMDIDGSLLLTGVAEAENKFPKIRETGSLHFHGRIYTEISTSIMKGSLLFAGAMEARNSIYQTTVDGSLRFVGAIDSTSHRPNEIGGSLLFNGIINTKNDSECSLPSHSDLRWS